MSFAVKNGQTSVVLRVKLLDSSSTVGAGLTGLTNSSSGLVISTIADNESSATAYTQAGSTIQTITTLGTYAAPSASNVRFKEVDSTNHKGIYELQIADARFAVSSAKSLLISISGATNLAQCDYLVPLVMDDPYVAKVTSGTGTGQISLSSGAVTVGTNNDKTGYTASTVTDKTGYSLSQTFPTNFASLSIDGSGRVDVGKTLGTAVTLDANNVLNVSTKYLAGTAQTARDIGASVLLSAGTGTGQLDFTSGVVKANLAQILGTALTETAGQIAAGFKKFFNIATPASTMDALTLVATATNLTNAPTSGDFTSTMKTSLNAATPAVTVSDKTGFKLASDGLSAVTAWTVAITGNIAGNLSGSVGSVTTVSDKTGYSLTQAFPTNFSVLGIGAGGHILNVDTLTTYTGNTPQTGDAFALIGTAGAGLTALGDTRLAHLDADVSSRASPTNITAGTITTVTNLTNAPTAGGLTTTMKTDVENAVWNATMSSHTTSLTTGAALNAAGGAGDPWATALPGSYGAGTAGHILGANLDAAVSTRLATSGYTAPDNSDISAIKSTIGTAGAGLTALGDTRLVHLDADISSRSTFAGGAVASVTGNVGGNVVGSVGSVTGFNVALVDAAVSTRLSASSYTAPDNADIAAIKAKTDSLTFTVSGKVDSNIEAVNGVTVTGNGSTGSPWGPA